MSNKQVIVKLNVGGYKFETEFSNLIRSRPLVLSVMQQIHDDEVFIDRDGQHFAYILNYLRTNELVLPPKFDFVELLIKEVSHYRLKSLEKELNVWKQNNVRGGTKIVIFTLEKIGSNVTSIFCPMKFLIEIASIVEHEFVAFFCNQFDFDVMCFCLIICDHNGANIIVKPLLQDKYNDQMTSILHNVACTYSVLVNNTFSSFYLTLNNNIFSSRNSLLTLLFKVGQLNFMSAFFPNNSQITETWSIS